MSALNQVMRVVDAHQISDQLLKSDGGDIFGGLITNGQYAWFASGSKMIIYSKLLGSVVSSKSFAVNQKDKSIKITFVKELKNSEDTCNLLLVGCSFKLSGLLFICQLTTLTTIRCIEIPNPISYIAAILNEPYFEDQLCDEFKIMSTVLLVGMASGAVYAIDLRQNHIEMQLRTNEIVINESRPSKLFILRKNDNCQDVKDMSNDSDCHLAMFINENFYAYCKKIYGKLNLNVSSLLYIKEINTIAIGYSTGHFQLWDCKIMRTIYLLKEPKCVMPITHINFLEPSDDPNNLCYLWVIQSDNSKLPNATMIALTYSERMIMPNGFISYRIYQGNGVKLEMSLKRETGFGRCISALSICNVNMFRMENDMDEDCEIRLFSMLIEIRQNADNDPESYLFLFDINQWYKAQMPSTISHLKISNSFASFVKLPDNVSYLDFKMTDKTLRPFNYNFRNNVEELYYPSSIYFECDCLVDKEIIRFKHAGVQQQILDDLHSKSWRLLKNPSLVFNQCLQTNLRPFFWDKPDDYENYSLPDQRSFVISILIEHKMMSVISECAEQWKNGTYVSSEATILHLVQSLWKHVMVVKQYADKLCIPLFDYSGTELDKKNERILNHCLSQMQCVKHFLRELHNAYGVNIINVDYSYRVYTLNLVTEYFKAVTCFLHYGLLPETIEKYPIQRNIQCDFTALIEYANKRRMEFGSSQLYLVDGIVINEPKGNKLIEQWLHEGGEITRGMYPPTNVQCLLRIYLNAALSDLVKNYITVYFLIDICSTHNVDAKVANRMCNFVAEFDIENKGLNTLCRASWLLDHDMFEDAMIILSSNNEWITSNNDISWFHWTVLKLLVFKAEYSWAQFYFKLINIDLVEIDDHKFYINIQVMNNCCFEALNYVRERSFKDKQILFEYLFDRCRELKKFKSLIEYTLDLEEEHLFFSYLKKINDPESLTFQLLFLLQRGRYLEASELNKSLSGFINKSNNDALTITSLLVKRFDKNIPEIMRQNHNRPPMKNVYKKTEVFIKNINSDGNIFHELDKTNDSILRINKSSNSINLILPTSKNTLKRSSTYDIVPNEKYRKIDVNDIVNSEETDNEIVTPIGKKVLDILNTPLVEKTKASPCIKSIPSILKTGSAKKHSRILSIKGDETPTSKTLIRFSLPGDDDNKIEQVSFITDNQECGNNNVSGSINNLPSTLTKQSQINLIELLNDDSKAKLDSVVITAEKENIDYEKMDISDEYSYSEHKYLKSDSICQLDSNISTENVIVSDDEEKEKQMQSTKLVHENIEIPLSIDRIIDIRVYSPMDTYSSYISQVNENVCNDDDVKIVEADYKTNDVNEAAMMILDSENETNDKNENPVMILVSENESANESFETENADESFETKDEYTDESFETKDEIVDMYIETKEENANESFETKEENSNESFETKEENANESFETKEENSNESFEIKEENSNESFETKEENANESFETKEENSNESFETKEENAHESFETKEENTHESFETKEENAHESFETKKENAHESFETKEENADISFETEDYEDNDDVDDENSSFIDSSSSAKSLDGSSVSYVASSVSSDESDLDITRYGRFKSSKEINQSQESQSDRNRKNNIASISLDTDSEVSDQVNEHHSDDDNIVENLNPDDEDIVCLDSGDENENLPETDDEVKTIDEENEIPEEEEDEESYVEEIAGDRYNEVVDDEYEDEDESLKSLDSSIISIVSSNDSRLKSSKSNYSEDDMSEVEENVLELYNDKSYDGNDIYIAQNKSIHTEDQSFIPLGDSQLSNNGNFDNNHSQKIISPESQKIDKTILGESTNMLIEDLQTQEDDTKSIMSAKNYVKSHIDNTSVDDTHILDICSEHSSMVSCEKKIEERSLEKTEVDLNPLSITLAKKQKQDCEYDENINIEIFNTQNVCIDVQQNTSSENDNCIEMSSPIPDDGFNCLVTESESSQHKVDVNQSAQFLFGEPLFGQKEIPDKPMLLFGQVYSFKNEQIVVDSDDKKQELPDLIVENCEDVFINKEIEEGDITDDIQDILELESLPESNPDENIDVHKQSRSNSLKEVCDDDSQSSVVLDNSILSTTIISKNIDKQLSDTEKQITETYVELQPMENEESEIHNNSNKNLDNQFLSTQPEKSCNIDNNLQNNTNDRQIDNINIIETKSSESSFDNVHYQNIKEQSLISQSCSNPKNSVQKKLNTTSIITRSRRTKSVSSLSSMEHSNIYNDNDQLLHIEKKNNTLEFFSQEKSVNTPISYSRTMSSPHLNKIESNDFSESAITDLNNKEIKHIQVIESKDIEFQQVNPSILNSNDTNDQICEPQKSYIFESKELVETGIDKSSLENTQSNEINVQLKEGAAFVLPDEQVPLEQPLMPSNSDKLIDKTAVLLETSHVVLHKLPNDLIHSIQKSAKEKEQPLIKKGNDLEYSLQENVQSTKEIQNCGRRVSLRKKEPKSYIDIEEKYDEPNTSKSYINRQITKDKSKSISLPNSDIIPTNSKNKCEIINQPDICTSNIFRPSGIDDDSCRQVRVILSKKKSKSQENLAITKRRSGRRSKSVASVEDPISTRNIGFGLEIIPEETSNPDKNVVIERSVITRKSKFNFQTNKTKEIKHDSKTFNLQLNTVVKTPRRAKSVQPDPVLTLSAVKKRPKRSSSVNSLILNDNSPIAKNDFMKVLEKVFTSPKEKKRCSSEPEKNRKRQKTSKHIAESKPSTSNQNLNPNVAYTDMELSPIPGNNSNHMLFTPAMKRTKIHMAPLNSEIEESNSIMTRSKINNSMKMEHIESNQSMYESLDKPSNKSKLQNSQIKTEGKSVTKQRNKNIKETINQIPIEYSDNVPSIETRRVTRYQQSMLEKSLQSTSVIDQQEESINDISVQKSEKKKISKRTNQKK